MELLFNVITELLIYFWSSFINMAEWSISFPFFLSLIALPVIIIAKILFGSRRAVL